MRQSARASPGASNSARWRLIRLVGIGDRARFSPQARAGSFTWAKAGVSVSAMQSETTTNVQAASAARTLEASGRLTTDWWP